MKLNIFLLSFYLLVNPQTVTSISQSSEKGELLPFSLHSPANSEKMSEHINSISTIPSKTKKEDLGLASRDSRSGPWGFWGYMQNA